MSDLAIRVHELSKEYRIGGKKAKYKTVRDSFATLASAPLRLLKRGFNPRGDRESFWALDKLSFDVQRGSVIGVVGHNGAGKSTLLKILSRITEPTHGYAEIYGRVGSLLEVGTGFHPELTGGENIYLNGAILGMKRTEIQRKFDEIVDFAEVEKFIETPVKHYSSGMYLRLAFAVAAHLEPEILLVDEVLAVGDSAFQKKCLNKVSNISETGTTVLLVSHQLHAIRRLCQQSIWLNKGQLRMFDHTAQVLSAYEASMSTIQQESSDDFTPSRNGFIRWGLVGADGGWTQSTESAEDMTVKFEAAFQREVKNGRFRVTLQDPDGNILWGNTIDNINLTPGSYEFTYQLPYLPVKPGVYHWYAVMFDVEGWIDKWFAVPEMHIETVPLNVAREEQLLGILNIPFEFSMEETAAKVVS